MSDKRRILIVDDEPGIVKMVSKRLEIEGYEVSSAKDGEEALEMLAGQNPELVILDLMLPKMNGYEVCEKIKSDEHHADVPVILFTAMAQQQDKKHGFECGAEAYVCKPFTTQELLDKIKELLSKKSGA